MNIKAAFPSPWIRAVDLQGRDITLTIARFSPEEVVAKDGSKKPVIFFHGTEKGLVLNVVNGDTIDEMAGDTDNWPGQKITVYATKTDFGGKRVDCIRIREQTASQSETPLPAQPETSLPVQPETVPAEAPKDSEIPF